MYKILHILLVCSFAQLQAQQPFQVDVQLKGAKDGTKYFLTYEGANGEVKDSALVVTNTIVFNGKLEKEFVDAWVMGNYEGKLQYKKFWLGPGHTSIVQKTNTLREAQVNGSPINDHAAELDKLTAPFEKEMEKIEAKAEKLSKKGGNEEALLSLQQSYETLEKKEEQAERNYIRQYHDRYYSLNILHIMATTYGADSTKALFELMPEEFKQNKLGHDIKNYLTAYRKIEIGAPFAEVTQPDTSNQNISLSSKTGQWLLLEFWASWCGPCRQENPALLNVFQTFKDKGFTIYAVSLDKDKTQWINAIKKDKLPWLHVSDLKGDYNEASLTYSVSGIPDNVLINTEGKIVARGLDPGGLHAYLEKVLK